MRVRAFVLVSLLVSAGACGGSAEPLQEQPQEQLTPQSARSAPADFHGGACEPPERICKTDGPGSRGSYACPAGGVGYYCCGFAEGELQQLASKGDLYARHCAHRYSSTNEHDTPTQGRSPSWLSSP